MTRFSTSSPEADSIAGCFLCKEVFELNSEEAMVVTIDPKTGLPPDFNPATGKMDRPLTEDVLGRVRRMPVCPACVDRVNTERLRLGLAPWR